MNEINVRLNLGTPEGVKALQALASAFAPATGHAAEPSAAQESPTPTPAPAPAAGPAPEPSPTAPATSTGTPSSTPASTPEAGEPIRRRRRKAEIEEDIAAGKDEEFKKLAKAHPDRSVEEIRARIYGADSVEAAAGPTDDEPEAAFVQPQAPEPAVAPEPAGDWDAFSGGEVPPATDDGDDWTPSW